MVLIPCPECKHKMSNEAHVCPSCGHPLRRMLDGSLFPPEAERASYEAKVARSRAAAVPREEAERELREAERELREEWEALREVRSRMALGYACSPRPRTRMSCSPH